MEKRGILEVRMFGGFAMIWDGRRISTTAKGSDSQFMRLMQILLHNGDKGVERQQLQDLLFGDSKAEDIHHLLRSVIYNARKKLKSEGLPDVSYITYKEGSYYWTGEIPLQLDTADFERLCAEAAAETDSSARLSLALSACSLYQGSFLPQQASLDWVEKEDRRYRQLFKDTVSIAADCLRETGDSQTLERLGRDAVKVCPLNEMEAFVMEALVASSRYREAQKYFTETAEYYQKELGVKASTVIMHRLEEIAEDISLRSDLPDLVKNHLFDQLEEAGGFFCTYPVFKGICRLARRNKERNGIGCCLMVCNLREDKAGRRLSDRQIEKIYQHMDSIIANSVRKSDVICRYGKGRYLVLLINIDPEDCGIVTDRIDAGFSKHSGGCPISYHIEAL